MKFEIKSTRNKENCIYKTLYLKQCLFMQIEEIAAKYDTSFNNVVISMIEHCLEETEGTAGSGNAKQER